MFLYIQGLWVKLDAVCIAYVYNYGKLDSLSVYITCTRVTRQILAAWWD